MPIKISSEDLRTLSEFSGIEWLASLRVFLAEGKDGPNNTYYFYGYRRDNARHLKVAVIHLEQILQKLSSGLHGHMAASNLFKTINEIYQAGITTKLQTVFLYGGNTA